MSTIEKIANLEDQFTKLPDFVRTYFVRENLSPKDRVNVDTAFIKDYKYHMKNIRALCKNDNDYIDSMNYLAYVLGGKDE